MSLLAEAWVNLTLKIILPHNIYDSIGFQSDSPSSLYMPKPYLFSLFSLSPCVEHAATSSLTVFFLLCFRTFCWWSSGPNLGPVEVQLSGEPPDGGVRGQAEPHPSPSAFSPTTTTCGQRKGMQPELPDCYRQVLWWTFWRW